MYENILYIVLFCYNNKKTRQNIVFFTLYSQTFFFTAKTSIAIKWKLSILQNNLTSQDNQ